MRKPVDVDLVKAEVDTTPKFQRREIATLAPIVDGVDVDTEVLRQFVTLNHRREVVGCHGHSYFFVAQFLLLNLNLRIIQVPLLVPFLGVELGHSEGIRHWLSIDVAIKRLFLDVAAPAHNVAHREAFFAF